MPTGNALAGRTALISGGAQGIGRAIAERFQQAGAAIIVLDIDVAAGERTAAELSGKHGQPPVSFVAADLSVDSQVDHALREIGARCGQLNVLVNNAGIEIEKPFASLSVGDWDRIMDVNLRGAFLLTQAALPLFPASGGAIVNISSIHATHAFADSLPYACSKAGLIALTRNLALELAPRHIRVNTICPGYVDTRLWDEYLRHSSDPAEFDARTAALHPVGRRGMPSDIAESALFLAADGASFVTGTSLVVDGGLTIRAHP